MATKFHISIPPDPMQQSYMQQRNVVALLWTKLNFHFPPKIFQFPLNNPLLHMT
ncbi:unnamed protein product [Rhodiola kirilowii]